MCNASSSQESSMRVKWLSRRWLPAKSPVRRAGSCLECEAKRQLCLADVDEVRQHSHGPNYSCPLPRGNHPSARCVVTKSAALGLAVHPLFTAVFLKLRPVATFNTHG